jgi:GrpE
MSLPSHPEDFSFFPGQVAPGSPLSHAYSHRTDASNPHPSIENESEEEEYEEYWESDDAPASRLADWKSTLRDDFESWLDTLEEIPTELSEEHEPDENPDLATVFGDLSSLALESRKSNRRTTEAFSQWNAVLTGFQDDLKRLRERERVLLESLPPSDSVPAPLAAFLVDFHDRLTRLALAQTQMPAARRGFFGDDTAWKTAWKNQRAALDITLSHLQTFLKDQGFQRINALGQPLDSSRMTVIETRLEPGKPPHIVIEETAPGWLLGSRVLRPAQVVVAIHPPTSTS